MIPLDRKLLWLFLTAILLIGAIFFRIPETYPKELSERENNDLILVQDNTIMASVIPAWLKPTVYGSLVACLEKEESLICKIQQREKCIGQAGEIGELQFMPSTFQQYCVEQFNLRDDIENAEIQRMCADYMIQDNWDNVYHWTTARKCLNN